MKKVSLMVVAIGALATSTLAYSGAYVNFGAGVVVPKPSDFNVTASSNTILNSPTGSGTGFFNLPSVSLNNHFKDGVILPSQ